MKLCVILGDGIGREVIPAAVNVVQKILPTVEIHYAEAGWETFQKTGTSLPESTIKLAGAAGAVLAGAASSPSYPVAGYFSPIVRLRRELMMHANLRPVHYWPVPTAREGVDLIVVRENTEDVYTGEDASSNEESASVKKVVTRAASQRIAHTAYRLARLAKRRLVTVVHKANLLPNTDGLFRRAAFEVAKDYGDIDTDELLVDTAAYWMVKEPTRFDIVLTMNQYGDILSDMASAWGGGPGFAPALNIGDDVGMAEPMHGTAPDIEGKGLANPAAAILSVALLARYYWHLPEIAQEIEDAVRQTLEAGIYTSDVRQSGAVKTSEFAREVCGRL